MKSFDGSPVYSKIVHAALFEATGITPHSAEPDTAHWSVLLPVAGDAMLTDDMRIVRRMLVVRALIDSSGSAVVVSEVGSDAAKVFTTKVPLRTIDSMRTLVENALSHSGVVTQPAG